MQEFKRIAALYGMIVNIIPWNQHHATYSCEDIEIWEVRRQPHHIGTLVINGDLDNEVTSELLDRTEIPELMHNEEFPAKVECLSWGEQIEELRINISWNSDNIPVTIKQDISKGTVGGLLWPSAVVASR